MKNNERALPRVTGDWAEDLACRELCANALQLLCRNYRCRHGEIDLVMRDGDTLVFVEVRYRRRKQFGSGAESVHMHKQQRLIATAEHYLARHPDAQDFPCRFDVVSIASEPENAEIDWIRDAFQT